MNIRLMNTRGESGWLNAEKQKTNVGEFTHAGVLSGIRLLLNARDHQHGYLTLCHRRSPSGKKTNLKSWTAAAMCDMFEQMKYWKMPVVYVVSFGMNTIDID